MSDASSTTPQGYVPPEPASADTGVRLHLAMLHSARARGDRHAAEQAWLWLVQAELERVRGIARAFRDDALPGGQIPPSAIDDVAHDVFLRLHNKVESLKGRSVGELRNFMRTATTFTCRDFVRAYVKDDVTRAGSLDARSEDGAPTTTDRALAQLAAVLNDDGVNGDIAREMIHAGLALVDEGKRTVLVMDTQGFGTEEIMERLGLTRDNVYQRRRRGLVQLRDAIIELEGEDAGQ